MVTEDKKYIELRQERDFGQVISASFEFMFSGFTGFFKTVFAITGFTFVAAVSLFSLVVYKLINENYPQYYRKYQRGRFGESLFSDSDTIYIFLGVLLLLFSVMFTYITIYCYMKIYAGNKRLREISTHEVWMDVRKLMWRYLGGGFIYLLFVTLLVMIAVMFSAVHGFLAFVAMLGVYALIFYAYHYFTVLVNEENTGVLDAFGRSFYLVRGKWWFTFGVAVVFSLLGNVLSLSLGLIFTVLLSIFVNLFGITATYTGYAFGVAGGVLGVIYLYMIFCFLVVKNGIMYYSMAEEKDSTGLLEKIHALGASGSTDGEYSIKTERNQQQYTRDDSEGDF